MATSLTYTTVVDALLRRVPEFADSRELSHRDLPHDVFGTFALWLCRLSAHDDRTAVAQRAVALINEMANAPDDDVVNLLQVSVFEILLDDPQCLRNLQRHMSVTALEQLDRIRRNLEEA